MPFKKWFNTILNYEQRFAGAKAPYRPIEPFEYVVDEEFVVGNYVFRPLVYFFAHQILPQAFFDDHPLLKFALQNSETQEATFRHFWTKSAMVCDQQELWSSGAIDDDRCLTYLESFERATFCSPLTVDSHALWIIKTPDPVTRGETHFLALSEASKENADGIPVMRSKRYFTLESTAKANMSCFCEWTAEGQHHNFGFVESQRLERFIDLVIQRLRQRR